MLPQTPHPDTIFSGLIPPNPLAETLAAIFSHNWGFIHKDVADPSWQTETGYPLNPRRLWALWQNFTTLVGVRFGKLTRYAMLDIDAESPYHPDHNPAALRSLIHSLESIGVYRTLLIRSSDSNGLHLYIPFSAPLPTYGVAVAIKWCLVESGFNFAPGALESFPNCKGYLKGGFTNYTGHRLPLQTGSFILDQDGEIISNDLSQFLGMFEAAASGNDMGELKEAIAVSKVKNKNAGRTSESRSARKWREDSELDIRGGFTAAGQTNELLKIIARYGIVFQSLAGDDLIAYVIRTITTAPGYSEFCHHQHEIEMRSRRWAIECEKYYRPHPSCSPGLGNPWKSEREEGAEKVDRRLAVNAAKSSNAIERITAAVAAITDQAATSIRARANTIAAVAKCSLATLYRNPHLWHPEHLVDSDCNAALESDLESTQPLLDLPSESLKTLPNQPLQSGGLKKVENRAIASAPDQTSKKTPSQPPPTANRFDFRDRICQKNGERYPETRSQVRLRLFGVNKSLTRVKTTLTLLRASPLFCTFSNFRNQLL